MKNNIISCSFCDTSHVSASFCSLRQYSGCVPKKYFSAVYAYFQAYVQLIKLHHALCGGKHLQRHCHQNQLHVGLQLLVEFNEMQQMAALMFIKENDKARQ